MSLLSLCRELFVVVKQCQDPELIQMITVDEGTCTVRTIRIALGRTSVEIGRHRYSMKQTNARVLAPHPFPGIITNAETQGMLPITKVSKNNLL